MTTDDASGIWAEPAPNAAAEWRQADVFDLDQVVYTADNGQADRFSTPHGVALVSQSCDVVLPGRLKVQVAPIVELSGETSRAARDGKRSRYAHLPHLGEDWFTDLDHVSTVSKAALLGRRVGPGVEGVEAARRYSGAVARRFGRFPFPDDISDAMKALRDLVQSKATKPESPFGRILMDVLELRAESRDWTTPAPDITLIFVLVPGTLPTLPEDDPGPMPDSIIRFQPDTTSAKSKLTEISQALTGPAMWNAIEKYWLWQMLADAAALMCQAQAARGAAEDGRVPAFVAEVVSADEFPLTRVRRSEIVDLDHLSAPFPLIEG